MTLLIIIAAALIVAGLAFYAGTLLWQLQQQSQAAARQLADKQQYLRDSIILICKAMRDEQCELSEGALRVWVLLDHLVPDHKPDPVTSYPGLHQMYQVVKDMPTHKARQAQAREVTARQDTVRLNAEQELKDFILADVEALLKRFQPA
jgi:hypothetical protein